MKNLKPNLNSKDLGPMLFAFIMNAFSSLEIDFRTAQKSTVIDPKELRLCLSSTRPMHRLCSVVPTEHDKKSASDLKSLRL